MNYIIIVDTRKNNGYVSAIKDEDDNMEIFHDNESIKKCLNNQILCQNFPVIIVDLDNGDIVEMTDILC